jgi:hypothetical protein
MVLPMAGLGAERPRDTDHPDVGSAPFSVVLRQSTVLIRSRRQRFQRTVAAIDELHLSFKKRCVYVFGV